ncbi:hypothetical protein KDC22_30090 [Paenibacillus tritici]|uniref:hypothetical protein n=1 Tax=Paenibacillus tritici TaxID=1873425 RepID=UPI001BAA47D1|nr:hypothetical protein [Paenibacillus tritici]QUL54480.1 hypothetical protein KDC22_30090 [Paenibacillus tritici]
MRNFLTKDRSTWVVFTLGFLLIILYSRFFSFMDEADNMLGAMSVAQGGDIYKSFFSQHTPFVYYFMSIFALIGVRDYETFRLCMGLVILCFWAFMYIRYISYFDSMVFKIFALLYALTINITWANMVLSDVFYGFSILFLLLESLIYIRTGTLSKKSVMVISVSIFMSVMSAFVSVYSVAILLFLLFIYDIYKKKFKENIPNYIKLAIIVAVPFLILLTWYWLTGNLYNFYYQAYKLNRVYYSNYNGLNNSSLGLMKQIMSSWINHIAYHATTFSKESVFSGLLLFLNLLFCHYHYKKDRALAILIFIFLAFTGVRGFEGFHAIPYYIVSFFNSSFIINHYIFKKEIKAKEYMKNLIRISFFLLMILSLNNYAPNAGVNFNKANGIIAQSPYDEYINKLTDSNEEIWITSLTPQTYINSNRDPAMRAYILVPWYIDAFKNEIMEDLNTSRPRLIIFEKDSDVWGYKYSEFAKVVLDFLNTEYKPLNPDVDYEKNIYIRKDYFEEANNKLISHVEGIENGMLVSNGVNVYLIENDTKRYITNPDVFESLGFEWKDVITIDANELEKVRIGAPIE